MNYFSYKMAFWSLSRKRNIERKRLGKKLNDIESKGNWKERQEVYASESIDLEMLDEALSSLTTRYLLDKARKMFFPIPKVSNNPEYWEQGQYLAEWYLTNRGITEMRKSIRIEREERFNFASRWAIILIGVIGALTGMLAVILR